MKTKNITITEDALIKAYKNGNADQKNVLEQLFDKEMFHTKNIMERVKTFEDAVNELGENHPFVVEYRKLDNPTTDILTYMKIRIITAALNDGWEPKFIENEERYCPYFFFYTKKEYAEMNKERRADLILFCEDAYDDVHAYHGAYAGFAYACSDDVPSGASVSFGSRLCFKTRELAEYAGKRFIKLYADYYRK